MWIVLWGGGTTFKLYFPVPREIGNLAEVHAQSEKQLPKGNETILVVEDEELLLQMVQVLMETHGYTVLTAKDGQEAVDVFSINSDKIDLVITDMGLPKLTGMAEFQKLKEINPDVKVIFASGFFEPDDKTKLENAGAKAFLNKPYVIEDMMTKIREVLD